MIPSESISMDENSNVVIGKNLKIDGTAKMNGGLEPIHHYENVDGSGSTIDVYFETISSDDYHYFIGKCNDGFAIGAYTLNGRELSDYTIIRIGNPYDQEAYIYVKETGSDEINYPLANGDNTQSKLFTHTLTLTADKSYTLICQSTIDSHINSVSGLRSIMNISSASDSAILPVCATDLSGTAVLQVTTALCKIGAANVTAVTDKVTTL